MTPEVVRRWETDLDKGWYSNETNSAYKYHTASWMLSSLFLSRSIPISISNTFKKLYLSLTIMQKMQPVCYLNWAQTEHPASRQQTDYGWSNWILHFTPIIHSLYLPASMPLLVMLLWTVILNFHGLSRVCLKSEWSLLGF